ncbi:Bdr-repeat family protein [Plakobranchus ocellatus]|uniref:Bdr-repeat family protein n=1 Tax=Plakobranchus ocellatus TaxID=259542 RepID=A0AAV4DLQ1_9GAST|nr:Bdr-repeat family protein [Plakobranchus ocellatus]
MHEKFCASSRAYVSAVKTALRSQTRENAAEIFERAIDVLSPDFPDPTSIDGQTHKEEGGDGNELSTLKDSIAQMERQLQEAQNERSTLESKLESVRQEAQNERSTLESKLESVRHKAQNERSTLESKIESVRQEAQSNSSMKKNVRRLDSRLESLATETKDSIKELTEVSKENSANIQGLRKLQMLMNQKNQTTAAATAAAVTPPPTGATASALSRPLKGVRQRADFTVKVTADRLRPQIWDVQLLPGGRLVLADYNFTSVKLFDTQLEVLLTNRQCSVRNRCPIPEWFSVEREVSQACPISPLLFTVTGQHLHTLVCRSAPWRLAELDSHTVAVTLPNCPGINLLEVGVNSMKVKRTLRTSQKYFAVAAVNNHTLAVECGSTIDLIDLGGQVLRQICSSVGPRYMNITEDGYLMCSTSKNSIARVEVGTGTIVFNKSVPQIKDPFGVTITLDGSILVTDRFNNTLDLVSSQGVWIKQLWSVPSDGGRGDQLWSVSTDGSVCVCVTLCGRVHILDCL